jgi:hypothetical protein
MGGMIILDFKKKIIIRADRNMQEPLAKEIGVIISAITCWGLEAQAPSRSVQ